MTAEVAVVNRSAVALAADSVVTITRPNQATKTYNANKLFTLSKHAPIGVMVFGDANLVGVPWETIIKVYRRQLGEKRFSRIEEYAADFINYLSSSSSLFTEAAQAAWLEEILGGFFYYIDDAIDEAVKGYIEKHGPIPKAHIPTLVKSVIEFHYVHGTEQSPRDGFPDSASKAIRSAIEGKFEKLIAGSLAKKPLDEGDRQKLIETAVMLFTKDGEFPSSSGIVLAGFGEDEFFPVVKSFRFFGVCCKQLIYSRMPSESFDGPGCAVLPFAQRDVADSFLQGIDGHNIDLLQRYVSLVLHRLIRTFSEAVGTENPKKSELISNLEAAATSAMESLAEKIQEHLNLKHLAPLLQTVAVLPKEELAILAEALVNLTSIKRKISLDVETVGGPTDVAVISKGDGFIWIRRKHYFEPTMNPYFVHNYLDR